MFCLVDWIMLFLSGWHINIKDNKTLKSLMKEKLNVYFSKMIASKKQGTETNICFMLAPYGLCHTRICITFYFKFCQICKLDQSAKVNLISNFFELLWTSCISGPFIMDGIIFLFGFLKPSSSILLNTHFEWNRLLANPPPLWLMTSFMNRSFVKLTALVQEDIWNAC